MFKVRGSRFNVQSSRFEVQRSTSEVRGPEEPIGGVGDRGMGRSYGIRLPFTRSRLLPLAGCASASSPLCFSAFFSLLPPHLRTGAIPSVIPSAGSDGSRREATTQHREAHDLLGLLLTIRSADRQYDSRVWKGCRGK
jgi:hypothetical protein